MVLAGGRRSNVWRQDLLCGPRVSRGGVLPPVCGQRCDNPGQPLRGAALALQLARRSHDADASDLGTHTAGDAGANAGTHTGANASAHSSADASTDTSAHTLTDARANAGADTSTHTSTNARTHRC
mmetsp:Transcript_28049/g.79651  ORF Transcript_28049/g.79651 Transcript_28049/m.79651 type:complete len:126 (-) Transcript_28049:43-420(-)